MGKDTDRKEAFGGPGIPPRWTRAAKDGVGTAYASSSRLWFTLWNGVVTGGFLELVRYGIREADRYLPGKRACRPLEIR